MNKRESQRLIFDLGIKTRLPVLINARRFVPSLGVRIRRVDRAAKSAARLFNYRRAIERCSRISTIRIDGKPGVRRDLLLRRRRRAIFLSRETIYRRSRRSEVEEARDESTISRRDTRT